MAVVKFGPWQPDLPDYENQGLTEALNVIPGSGGYRPFPSPAVVGSSDVSATVVGAIAFVDDLNTKKCMYVCIIGNHESATCLLPQVRHQGR